MRPLAALRSSVRATAEGDFDANAKASGPEEVASLARDFNDMLARRRSAEEALRDSDERYRTLFDHSLDAVYVHDFEGRFIDANDTALNLLGYDREEISNLLFIDLIDDLQFPAALAAIDEIKEDRRASATRTVQTSTKGRRVCRHRGGSRSRAEGGPAPPSSRG